MALKGRRRPRPTLRPAFTMPPFHVMQVLTGPERVDWGLRLAQIQAVWSVTRGEDVLVGVVDTGIATSHPDLAGAVAASRDFSGSPAGSADEVGHGTHVAGVIAARENGVGVVGVAPRARVLNAKVLRRPGEGITEQAVADAVRWCVEQGADLLCISLQSPRRTPLVRAAIAEAAAGGAFALCAAGNAGPVADSISWPAAYDETVAVGYVMRDADGRVAVAPDSSRGPEVDVVAPGGHILSTFPPSVYALASGTSMATPFAAGVAALLIARRKATGARPIPDVSVLRRMLAWRATDLYTPGRDPYSGWGVVNPEQVVLHATA